MKRARFAIILVLVVTFVLAEPSPLAPRSPFLKGRLAFFSYPSDPEREDRLYLAELKTGETMLLAIATGGFVPPVWSPNGKRLATGVGNNVWTQPGLVIDIERGMVAHMDWPYLWGRFHSWIPDNRYAIFSSSDQYGNGQISVFDVMEWKVIIDSTGTGCMNAYDPYGSCQADLVATSPVSPLVLVEPGNLIQLPTLTSVAILTNTSVVNAAWSPSGELLALVGRSSMPDSENCAMYLAQGDGTQVLGSIPIMCQGGYIQWSPDERSVIFKGSEATYTWHTEHQAVDVRSWLLDEHFSWPAPVDPCVNVKRFEHMNSPLLGKVASACWSPDKALLAVGTEGALKIYDAQLNLIYSIPVTGTVHSIAWSPVP